MVSGPPTSLLHAGIGDSTRPETTTPPKRMTRLTYSELTLSFSAMDGLCRFGARTPVSPTSPPVPSLPWQLAQLAVTWISGVGGPNSSCP